MPPGFSIWNRVGTLMFISDLSAGETALYVVPLSSIYPLLVGSGGPAVQSTIETSKLTGSIFVARVTLP